MVAAKSTGVPLVLVSEMVRVYPDAPCGAVSIPKPGAILTTSSACVAALTAVVTVRVIGLPADGVSVIWPVHNPGVIPVTDTPTETVVGVVLEVGVADNQLAGQVEDAGEEDETVNCKAWPAVWTDTNCEAGGIAPV